MFAARCKSKVTHNYVFAVRCLGYNPEEFRVKWTFKNTNDGRQLGPFYADTIDGRILVGKESERAPLGVVIVLMSSIEYLAGGKKDGDHWADVTVNCSIERKDI